MSDKKGSEEEGDSSQTDGREVGSRGSLGMNMEVLLLSLLPDWRSLLCPVANEDTRSVCVCVNVGVWLKIQRRGLDRLKVRCRLVN